ncbi:hypothetical protein [Algoriphagus winogradskyi]|uniref:NfeD-like C-terminal domain-containing protein n=1 Tax=Algoriphagus winogradskyi TaxID=237017 RepID=A0ABY1NBS7_9BACT|nr:hypothetical protein [Algoriphagus winogradskyi]SMP05332.1 hypothetical protein SAMN06265367_101339 [Algoriphagus winogradskyi]
MEENLTEEEILFLKEGVEFYESTKIKILKISAFSITVFTLLMVVLKKPLDMILIVISIGCLLAIYLCFTVSMVPLIRTKKDIRGGIKLIRQTTIQKTKISKGQTNYILNNGFKVADIDFEEDNLKSNVPKIGQTLLIKYTPHQKMVLSAKIIDEYST